MKHTLSRTVLLGVAILLLVEFAGLALYFQIDVNQSVMERTVSGVRELLESNAEILNRTIYEIDDRLNHMIVDEQMYALILSMHDQDVVRRVSWQDDMRRIVFSFLSSSSHHSLSYSVTKRERTLSYSFGSMRLAMSGFMVHWPQ